MTKDQALAAFREYTGEPTDEFDMYADPKVPGCWAGRSTRDPMMGLLADAHAKSGDDVEEFEVDVWPPKSGNLRFF